MVDGRKIAQEFHDAYERMAPSFGYETRKETKAFDPGSPNGRLMIAVCTLIGNRIQLEGFEAGFKTGLREGPPRPDQVECPSCMNRGSSHASIEHESWCKVGNSDEQQAALDRRREAEEEDPGERSSDDVNQEAGEMP